MDGSHYSSNVINGTSTPSYPSSAASTPQGLQPHTLPPLQQQQPQHQQHQQHNNGIMQSATPYGSYPHTPRTPATPGTPGPQNMATYPPPPNTNGGRGYQMMPNSAYQQPPYTATSSAMLPQTSTAMAHPQPIAPAPAPGSRGPPVLRPMPAGGVMPQPGMSSPYNQSPLMPQNMLPETEQPTHVVGSQGRRGILPSAPGRPAPPAAGSVNKNQIPQKDADGKFPCPHCTKTYLHAKHLKRHLLRHTGDRPYMCVLCRDTFSRSDILKRHFQKCSIRRGNPTGASHLSHPHAHVKKNQQAQQKQLVEGGDMSHMNGMGNVQADGMVHPYGLIPPGAEGMPNNGMPNDQTQLSRQGSMQRMDDRNAAAAAAAGAAGNVMAGPPRGANGAPAGSHPAPGSFDQSAAYNGSGMNPAAAGMNPQLANYNMPTGQNGMPMFPGQNGNAQSGLDWSTMFQQPGAQQPTQLSSYPPFLPNTRQTQNATRQERNATTGVDPAGLPAEVGREDNVLTDRSLFFGRGAVPPHIQDPYLELSSRILSFLRPPPDQPPNNLSVSASMALFFSPENLRDFLEMYTHFHVHFPVLHIPTFRILEAYTGLLAAMSCIGACYAENLAADQVREMTDIVHTALQRESPMLAALRHTSVDRHPLDIKYEDGSFAGCTRDIEELQAIILMLLLLCWNGTPEQRQQGREILPLLALLSRKANLTTTSPVSSAPMLPYSFLHQPEFSLAPPSPSQPLPIFDWEAWVDQEKRIRIMHSILACDCAFGLYFNTSPFFDPFEISVPLPADDAAWEANDAQECTEALGLRGLEAAAIRNPDGTRRPRQPELNSALSALLHDSSQILADATNLYGKFVLVHALVGIMRRVQTHGDMYLSNALTAVPIIQCDWIVGISQDDATAMAVARANNEGLPTAADNVLSPEMVHVLSTALDKFKRNWDIDMASQFVPSAALNPRRRGFSRDGVHYYWVAKYLLKNTRSSDLRLPSDQRFAQVIRMLKSVKNWVMSDSASRGEELGSIGDIDRGYGSVNLTLDFTNLFRPLPMVTETVGFSAITAAA